MNNNYAGETNLNKLLKTLRPKLNAGEYVYCLVDDLQRVPLQETLFFFREQEGHTIIVSRETAERYKLAYTYIASWITLTVHSSLEAVGLTAVFSKALADTGISCNVVAAYHHDHLFVSSSDATKALKVLEGLSQTAS